MSTQNFLPMIFGLALFFTITNLIDASSLEAASKPKRRASLTQAFTSAFRNLRTDAAASKKADSPLSVSHLVQAYLYHTEEPNRLIEIYNRARGMFKHFLNIQHLPLSAEAYESTGRVDHLLPFEMAVSFVERRSEVITSRSGNEFRLGSFIESLDPSLPVLSTLDPQLAIDFSGACRLAEFAMRSKGKLSADDEEVLMLYESIDWTSIPIKNRLAFLEKNAHELEPIMFKHRALLILCAGDKSHFSEVEKAKLIGADTIFPVLKALRDDVSALTLQAPSIDADRPEGSWL